MENPVLVPSGGAKGVNNASSAMDTLIANLIEDRAPLLGSVLVILIAAIATSFLIGDKTNVPLVGEEWGNAEKRRQAYMTHARDLYHKGYEMFKKKTFRLTTMDGDQYVVPHDALDELRQLPDNHVNIDKAFEMMNLDRYIKLGGDHKLTRAMVHTVKADLTHNLSKINPALTEEVAKTVAETLGDCEDWTSINPTHRLLRIVAIVSGRIFLGPDLCRREEYIHAAINYTVDVFTTIPKLRAWRWWLRPIGQYFVADMKKIEEHKRKMKEFLRPVIADRKKRMAAGEEMPEDMLQWMLNKNDKFGLTDDELAQNQLGLSVAAIHTTTITTTLMLYDLVVRPDLVNDLRTEIRTVLAENDNIMTPHAQYSMKLLDSTMKESQRVNPGSLVRFQRYAFKPITLSDGSHIPAGSFIQAPHAHIVKDPTYYPEPEKFNPRRFLDLRNGETEDPIGYRNKDTYMFATSSSHFMAFGYGKHACPGRYFATNEIKLILARILLDYDMKMPEGETERYKNLEFGIDDLPDTSKQIMFRKVKA